MDRNSSSCIPVVEPVATRVRPDHRPQAETGQVPAVITDVLTIGEDAAVFRPVQRAPRTTGWAVAHVSSVEAAISWLHSNVAAVAVAEAELAGGEWRTVLSALRNVDDAPEVVLVASGHVPLQDALRAGAFDLVQRPFNHSECSGR